MGKQGAYTPKSSHITSYNIRFVVKKQMNAKSNWNVHPLSTVNFSFASFRLHSIDCL